MRTRPSDINKNEENFESNDQSGYNKEIEEIFENHDLESSIQNKYLEFYFRYDHVICNTSPSA